MRERKWYKLDNVGKFYASISNHRIPKVFRYSATLTEEIDKVVLQIAFNETISMYPNFNVNLKKGLFWYYLDETNRKYEVSQENLPICFKIYNNSEDFLYRVSYFKNKINFEVSHILSDGRGSVEFFKALVSNYIKNKYEMKDMKVITNGSQAQKAEDSFDKYYKKTRLWNGKSVKPYIYKGKKMKNQTRYMECHLKASQVLEMAHKYHTTLTAFLVAVLIDSFKEELKISDLKKAIKVDLPVDLRTYFKSTSSMNFFGLTTISYQFKTKEDQLEDIIQEVSRQFKENINAEKLSERANLMVSFEKNWICRVMPIFLKNIILKIANELSAQASTTCLSNIGMIKMDEKIAEKIQSINVLTSTESFQFILCTFQDDLSIGISSKYRYNDVIKNFCRFFSNHDFDVQINVSEVD